MTPNGASSRASENVSALIAPLETEYAVPAVSPPVLAASELVLTMRPQRRAFIAGTTHWAQNSAPSRLAAITRRHLQRGALRVLARHADIADPEIALGGAGRIDQQHVPAAQ